MGDRVTLKPEVPGAVAGIAASMQASLHPTPFAYRLPTEIKVESGLSRSKSGTFVNLSKSGNPGPETRNLKPDTRHPTPESQKAKPETRNPEPENREPKTEILNPESETLIQY